VLFLLGVDPIWLGVMMAVNLQTSFLTPPFGFALFYLRGAVPDGLATPDLYRGVAPFIALQLGLLVLLALLPGLATWLPGVLAR
jgi:TRAP-type mannitol/chloroaromatic compound transport system permease large subunit